MLKTTSIMKNLTKVCLPVFVIFSLSGCNEAFMAGVAQGLANRPAPVYTSGSASSSSTSTLDQIRAKREKRKMEQNMKDMCEASGGRWRVGRCKY